MQTIVRGRTAAARAGAAAPLTLTALIASLLMALLAAAQPVAGASVVVSTWAGLVTALGDATVTDIQMATDIDWTAVQQTLNLTRNVRVWAPVTASQAQPNVAVYRRLNFNNQVQQIRLQPGVTLTFEGVFMFGHTNNYNGFNQQYISYSPNATVFYHSTLHERPVCLPLTTSLSNMLNFDRTPGVGGVQYPVLTNSTLCVASTSTPAVCVPSYIVLVDVQGIVPQSTDLIATGGQGGYTIVFANMTYFCLHQVNASCLATSSPVTCLDELQKQVDAEQKSTTPPSDSGDGGSDSGVAPWVAGVIAAGCVAGVALAGGFIFWRYRVSKARAQAVEQANSTPRVSLKIEGRQSDTDSQPARSKYGGSDGPNNSGGVLNNSGNGALTNLLQSKSRQGSANTPLTGGQGSLDEMTAEPLRQQVEALVRELRGAGQELSVLNAIGRGGNGVVYRGMWRNQEVAIKTIVVQGGETEFQRRAVLETAVSTAMTHANVVSTYHYDIVALDGASNTNLAVVGDRGTAICDPNAATTYKLYIVQEFCSLGDLDRALSTKRLCDANSPLPNTHAVLSILHDIASALAYVHSKHIIHGDLKPSNVLLKPDMQKPMQMIAKVCDFGLSTPLGMDKTHVSNYRGGTPFYVAPEVMHDNVVTQASDVFSFGVMLWEVVAGQHVYVRHADNSMSRNPAFGRFPAGTDRLMVQLLKGCLQREPKARPTFVQIMAHLQALQRLAREVEERALLKPPVAAAAVTAHQAYLMDSPFRAAASTPSPAESRRGSRASYSAANTAAGNTGGSAVVMGAAGAAAAAAGEAEHAPEDLEPTPQQASLPLPRDQPPSEEAAEEEGEECEEDNGERREWADEAREGEAQDLRDPADVSRKNTLATVPSEGSLQDDVVPVMLPHVGHAALGAIPQAALHYAQSLSAEDNLASRSQSSRVSRSGPSNGFSQASTGQTAYETSRAASNRPSTPGRSLPASNSLKTDHSSDPSGASGP